MVEEWTDIPLTDTEGKEQPWHDHNTDAPNGRGYTCDDFERRHWCGLYGDCSGDGEGVMELG